MSIITINRGSYSRGKQVAEKLALKLGYECISRDILLEASDEFNIPEIKLIRALHDPASVLERFLHGKEKYVNYIRTALLQHVCKDNIVYHGLAGQYFLRDIPHVLKVRISADMQERVKEEMRRENISAEKALYVLKKDDEERRKWAMQVYDTDPWDSRLYDIILHIGRLTADDAVDILFDTVRKPNFKTTPESQKLVENLTLASRVESDLAIIAPKIEVIAQGGRIIINNIAFENGSKEEDRIKSIVMQINGVEEVVFNIKTPADQRGHVNPFYNIG
ncbi:MAG: cytidylate kinase-like family protein [Deltaproteobacteria bacterium]|nr:cytidylate kinase-like family protein [Deltaproteobacteria bacterium]